MSDRAFRIADVAKHCGIEVCEIEAAIKAGTLARYGSGQGKVKVSDAVTALKLDPCPTCCEPIGRSAAAIEEPPK